MRMRRIHLLVVVLAGALMLSGCAAGADKAGADTEILQLATIDSVNPNGQYFGSQAFVDAIGEVSGGRLQVEVTVNYGDGAPDAESNLVAAIASGEVDLGIPSTRAFANAGITGLEAIEAPMTVTSYEAQKALVSGPIADEVLGRLEGTGVKGLGLSVGPLRRPFAAEAPLLGPEDWDGARVRVYNSPIQAESIRSLGGEPVDLSFGWMDEIRSGSLRGAEFDIAQYWTNGFRDEAGNVTGNVVLWPKVIVLSVSQKRWDVLSEQQRGWLREAAERAVQASAAATYDESAPARRLCEHGVRFVDASPDQIAALRGALAPVIQRLADDPDSGPLLASIQALAAEHTQVEPLDVPAECRQGSAGSNEIEPIPDETAALPDGTYRVDISEADVEAAGLSNGPGWSGTWTLQIEDGTYAMTCRPLDNPGRDCGNLTFDEVISYDTVLDAGFVKGSGDTIFFVYDADIHSQRTGCELPCFPVPTYQLTWALDGDTLTFSELRGADSMEKVIKPWRKID